LLYVPVAVICCVLPAFTDGFTGVTAIDTNSAAAVVIETVPVTPLSVAETSVVPTTVAAVMRPWVGEVFDTETTFAFSEAHVTVVVIV
jgi:hypothetical protein